MEFEFGSFLLAYALEHEDIVVEKTKGENDVIAGTSPTTHPRAKTRSLSSQEQNNNHYKHTKTNHQTIKTNILQLKRENLLSMGRILKLQPS
jgi:hypothetical protein